MEQFRGRLKRKLSWFLKLPQWYWFFVKLRPFTTKYAFLFICIIGLMWHAVYTNYIISRLHANGALSTEAYANLINAALFEKLDPEGEKFVKDNIAQQIEIPFIITTENWEPITWWNIQEGHFFSRRDVGQDFDNPKTKEIIKRKIEEFKHDYEPKIVYGRDRKTRFGYLVYSDSKLLGGLSWMPFVEGVFIVIFFGFVYFALHNIMITERSSIWVGLAKETAHQLGTPISSLMGWVEYIRTIRDSDEPVSPEIFISQLPSICDDMQKDITRLQKITSRFSQIGSKPTLMYGDLNELVRENIKYFRTRLPMFEKRIDIMPVFSDLPKVAFNRDLLEWVLENLFKNSVDAIEQERGLIEIQTQFVAQDNIARIIHIDNGRGIPWEHQKQVFVPGYTTKSRGWGLGLTLAKRIIEDYHSGQIYIAWSHRGKGTAFNIDLPIDHAVV
ncbi:MAG: hypothetical protein JW795_07495 [Chitinivibrionales bacterium]|nr:hypothetical protein [Chitinivibrionales bacterium]